MTTHDPKILFYSQLLSEANDRVVSANAENALLKQELASLKAKAESEKVLAEKTAALKPKVVPEDGHKA